MKLQMNMTQAIRIVPELRITINCQVCGTASCDVKDSAGPSLCKTDASIRLQSGYCPACSADGQYELNKKQFDAYFNNLPVVPDCSKLNTAETVQRGLWLLHVIDKLERRIDISEIRGLFDYPCAEYHRLNMDGKVQLLLLLVKHGFTPANLVRAVAGLLRIKGYDEFEIQEGGTA
jgi:hypothetical protein